MKVIVADSSPLIALSCSGHIDVLLSIVSQVLITETVFLECTAASGKPGAARIQEAVSDGRITQVPDPDMGIFGGISGLDMGEALAISQAHAMRVPILADDAVGRQVAKAHGTWHPCDRQLWHFARSQTAGPDSCGRPGHRNLQAGNRLLSFRRVD